MDTAVTLFKMATIAGILGLLLWRAGDVARLFAALMQIVARALGVASA